MWIVLAQLGVKIDTIQDNMIINFSVPSMSDYTAQTNAMPLVGDAPKGGPVAGDMLLIMANNLIFLLKMGLRQMVELDLNIGQN